MLIGGGRRNIAVDNIFVDVPVPLTLDARGVRRDYAHERPADPRVPTNGMTLLRRLAAANVTVRISCWFYVLCILTQQTGPDKLVAPRVRLDGRH